MTCSLCLPGYTLAKNAKSCIKNACFAHFSGNCQTCDEATGICTQCLEGFPMLSGGVCSDGMPGDSVLRCPT